MITTTRTLKQVYPYWKDKNGKKYKLMKKSKITGKSVLSNVHDMEWAEEEL